MEKTNIRYKASTKTMIASAYGISIYTFRKWLKPIKSDIGEYRGATYCPKQVEFIVNHFGEPVNKETISA